MTSNVGEGIPRSNSAAVDLAYGIAISAYASAQQRRDSVHQRIDVLLSFVTTVTVAGPVVAAAVLIAPAFGSPLLIGSGAVFAAIVVVGLVARLLGSLQQVSPKELHDGWLHFEEGEFKQRIIFWSGEHNDRARQLTYRKEVAAAAMTILFLIEAVLFLVWVATAN